MRKGKEIKPEPLWQWILGMFCLIMFGGTILLFITSNMQKQTEKATQATVGKQFIVKGENDNNVNMIVVVSNAIGDGDPFDLRKVASISGKIYVESPNKTLLSGDLCNSNGSMFGGCSERTVVLHWNDGSTQKIESLHMEIPGWDHVTVSPTGIEPMKNLP